MGAFAAGLVTPYALTCLLLWLAGSFHEFVFWTISYAGKYAAAIPLVNGAAMLKNGLDTVIGPNLGLWLLPGAGALLMWWEKRLPNRHRFLLTALFLCSLASASAGFYFREHYFITLLPVLALLTGVAVSRGLLLLRHDRTLELLFAVPLLLGFIVAVGAALVGNGSIWFGSSAAEAGQAIYNTSLFADAARAADYLKANTPKDARIAVLGSEPEIYFYSKRRSATGYIYTYPLMEAHPFARQMERQMIAEIERARPAYAVFVQDPYSWLAGTNSDPWIFNWWNSYWPAHFDVVMTFDVKNSPTQDAPSTTKPPHLLVYRRKDPRF